MFSSYCYPSVSISILLFQGQDNYLLDSSPSIRFLLKLLKPIVVETGPDKAPSISQKLLVLRKDMLLSHDMTNRVDSNSTAIIQKVLETLVSCKDLKASNVESDDLSRTELNPNWISLLTMEKACLSTISMEGRQTYSLITIEDVNIEFSCVEN